MRLTRLASPASQRIRDLLLDDPSLAIDQGRAIARDVPVPGCGVLDLLAAEPAGRLTIVCVRTEANAAEMAKALALHDWVTGNLPALRAMGGLTQADVDLTREPRLVLVSPAVTEDARRLAGRLSRPSVELLGASLVMAGESAALLVEPVSPIGPPAPIASAVDEELGAIAPGLARSLLRRVVEALREDAVVSSIEGGIDVIRAGERIGSLVCVHGGVEARLADGRVEPIATDEDCRRVAAILAAPPSRVAPARQVAAALTADELAELERGPGPAAHRAPAASPSSHGPSSAPAPEN